MLCIIGKLQNELSLILLLCTLLNNVRTYRLRNNKCYMEGMSALICSCVYVLKHRTIAMTTDLPKKTCHSALVTVLESIINPLFIMFAHFFGSSSANQRLGVESNPRSVQESPFGADWRGRAALLAPPPPPTTCPIRQLVRREPRLTRNYVFLISCL